MNQLLKQAREWTYPWYQIVVACVGAIAIVGGALQGQSTTAWGGLCALTVWGVTGWRLFETLKGRLKQRP